MVFMIASICVVVCVTISVGVHLGFYAVVGPYWLWTTKINRPSPPSPASATPPSPQDEWDYITHDQILKAIPEGIATAIAVAVEQSETADRGKVTLPPAVEQAATAADRPLATNVSTEGTDTKNQRDRSEAVPSNTVVGEAPKPRPSSRPSWAGIYVRS